MSQENPPYRIIYPEGYLEGPEIAQKEGQLDGVFVRFEEDGRRYRLFFMDYHQVAEDFVRHVALFKLEWLVEPGLIVVTKITPEIIVEAIEALYEQNYFDHFIPLANDKRRKGKLRDTAQFDLIFPHGYVSPDSQENFDYKGLVRGVRLELEDGRNYQLQFEDFFSFTRRFADGARFGEAYFGDPSFILLTRVTPELGRKAVTWLLEHDYFERFKPIE